MIYIDFVKLLYNSIGVQKIEIDYEQNLSKIQIIAIEFPELTISEVLEHATEVYYYSECEKYKYKNHELVLESTREPKGIPELTLFMEYSPYIVLICKAFVLFNQTRLIINSQDFVDEPLKASEIDNVTCVMWRGNSPSLIINGNLPIDFDSKRYKMQITVNGECQISKCYFFILQVSPIPREEFSIKIEECFDFFGLEQTDVEELERLTDGLVEDLVTMTSLDVDKAILRDAILKRL